MYTNVYQFDLNINILNISEKMPRTIPCSATAEYDEHGHVNLDPTATAEYDEHGHVNLDPTATAAMLPWTPAGVSLLCYLAKMTKVRRAGQKSYLRRTRRVRTLLSRHFYLKNCR